MMKSAFIFDDVCIPPEKQIGMHSHPRWELSYVVCGSGKRTIGDLTEPFGPGEIILIPPGIPHVWRFNPAETDADGNIANLSVFFESSLPESMIGLFPEMAGPLARIESLEHAISYKGKQYQTILRLLKLMRGKTPETRFPVMMELLIAISHTSCGICAGCNTSLSRAELRLEKVRVYCACNYSRPITIDEISRHVGMNKSAFCTFMRHSAGTTFSKYVNDIRLERAKDKLRHTDSVIAEIALGCGFQNVTYFNRLFRKKYGCSPTDFRAGHADRS